MLVNCAKHTKTKCASLIKKCHVYTRMYVFLSAPTHNENLLLRMDFSVWGSATPRCPNITLVKNEHYNRRYWFLACQSCNQTSKCTCIMYTLEILILFRNCHMTVLKLEVSITVVQEVWEFIVRKYLIIRLRPFKHNRKICEFIFHAF